MIGNEKEKQAEEKKKVEEKKEQQSEQSPPTIQKGNPKPTDPDISD